MGDSGSGESHLLIGLGTAAAQKGYRVKYTLATKLVNELVEGADDKQLARTIARYGRVDDLLCIDELGYMEVGRRGAELLLQVLTEREEKDSVAIAPNHAHPREVPSLSRRPGTSDHAAPADHHRVRKDEADLRAAARAQFLASPATDPDRLAQLEEQAPRRAARDYPDAADPLNPPLMAGDCLNNGVWGPA